MSRKTELALVDYFSGKYKLEDDGYVWRRKFLFRHAVPVNLFTNDFYDPLTFHTKEGTTISPGHQIHGYDQGSVPLLLQGVVSTNFGQKTTAIHDFVFEAHFWFENGKMVAVSLWRANNMLYRMARAEFAEACRQVKDPKNREKLLLWWDDKGNRISNGLAWTGVMLGGWLVWRKDPITLLNKRQFENAQAVLRAEAQENDFLKPLHPAE
jgi:hypothetical protein